MPNDLLIYELFGLEDLLRRGIVVSLGGQRFQFTRDYTHEPAFIHPTKPNLAPLKTSDRWSVTAGTVFYLMDMSGPDPMVQKPGQQAYSIMFEPGSAYAAYIGNVRFYGAEGPQSPEYGLDAPVAGTIQDGTYYRGGARVGLRGHGYDPQNQDVTYQWTQVSGPVVAIMDSDRQTAWFIAPSVFEQTSLVFRFTVDDGIKSAYADVTIRVRP